MGGWEGGSVGRTQHVCTSTRKRTYISMCCFLAVLEPHTLSLIVKLTSQTLFCAYCFPCALLSHAQYQTIAGVLRFDTAEAVFTFVEVPSEPVPSLLRGFSAPVKVGGWKH